MKNYKSFERITIGDSDIGSLTVRSLMTTHVLNFFGDGYYTAYICYGDDVEIGSHYRLDFSGKTWLIIYDEDGVTYKEHRNGEAFDIYRAGDYSCIIHWHSA